MNNKSICLFLFSFLCFFSCTDLSEEMYSSIGSDNFYQKYEHILQAISSAYVYMGDAHTYDTKNEELTADQVLTPTRGIHGYNDGEYVRYVTHNWTYLDDGVSAPWGRYFSVIGFSNNALIDISQMDYAVFGKTEEEKRRNISELRTLRAWAYLRLLDMYGGVPIVTDIIGEQVERNTAEETFDFIEKELNESLPDLPTKESEGVEDQIYRITKASNRMILMRLYLNSFMYIGKQMFEETKDICLNIIEGEFGKYRLDEKWNGPFTWDNINSPEIIFAFPNEKGKRDMKGWWYAGYHHYNSHLTFGSSHGEAGFNGWGLAPSIRANGDMLDYKLGMPFSRYHEKDVRKKQWNYLGNGEWEGMFLFGIQLTFDGKDTVRGTEEYAGLPLEFVDYCARMSEGDTTSNSLLNGEENTGIRPVKIYPSFPDIDSDLQARSDIPALRLAEVYFSLAECYLRMDDKHKAAEYINIVISRNYKLEDWQSDESLHITAEKLDDEGFRMLEEWGKEFLMENRRRGDLIRWGKFSTERWFNHDSPSDESKNIFPIPQSAINGNPLLEQNPGY